MKIDGRIRNSAHPGSNALLFIVRGVVREAKRQSTDDVEAMSSSIRSLKLSAVLQFGLPIHFQLTQKVLWTSLLNTVFGE